MSLLWAIPPVAVTVAALIALVQLRSIEEATTDLANQLHRLDEVRIAVAEVRTAASDARAAARGLRVR